MTPRKIELLAPAANADIAIQAILHGADAVYIGPSSFGARKNAANSIEEIKRVVDFAHPFRVKVYATVNTIVYDDEISAVERLVRDLYMIGVDAVIVQDMGLLRMDLPPIQLHASTQCDTRDAAKARFLQEAGFSQIVLARELSIPEIAEICRNVTVPVETFVHGALCVSYSGCCHASQATMGRSANRGECAQICRLPFTLKDADGKTLATDRHLLSLKDFNASQRLGQLLEAGVSSFKIEGRLKDASYVKNIVAYYRQCLDRIIDSSDGRYIRSSCGISEVTFTPDPAKSFNRGFTHYFLDTSRPSDISSPLTPKSMGEVINHISQLNNGDGISYFDARNEYKGLIVNRIDHGRIISNRPVAIPKGTIIHRTLDVQWEKTMNKNTARRTMWLDVHITPHSLQARDERGVEITVPLNADCQPAVRPQDLRGSFDRFGNTVYRLRNFSTSFTSDTFIPASQLADARRRMTEALALAAESTYPYALRDVEHKDFPFPTDKLDFHYNVANRLARRFYTDHGCKSIQDALELESGKGNIRESQPKQEISVMTTRHCILREMGCCLKESSHQKHSFRMPLSIHSGNRHFRLSFDCKRCEMHLWK
ncbi:MAG: U32 family peptidase [Muribaculaceae bacterium]|nr:U32 family peptidase [Muribaculaceae bacterium]